MTDCSSYRIEAVEGTDGFELIDYKGNRLLFTQSVSVQTLVNVCRDDKEGR
jgi:hypothetical protein